MTLPKQSEPSLPRTNCRRRSVRDRRAECQEWVESLTNEIEWVLLRAKVIPIAAAKREPSRRARPADH